MVASFPHFRIASDDPFERGRRLGSAAAAYVRGSIEVYAETFDYYTRLPWANVRELAARFREPIAEYDEAIMREIEGIAAGASLPVEDVLAINARTEIMFGFAVEQPLAECTAFFAGASATADGHVLLGQNWDWRTRCESTTVLVEVEQSERPSFVTLVEAGLVGKLGFNSAGIGVAINALVADIDRGESGVPFHVVCRGILDSHTLEEAVAAVVRAKRAASANYVIASADGRGVNLETGPGGAETVFVVHPTDDLLAHANNFTCAIPFGDVAASVWVDSATRVETMADHLHERRGSLTRETATELLTDHTGHPDSICRHPNQKKHEVDRSSTIGSWVVDLTDGLASICFGNPCSGEFTTFAPDLGAYRVSVPGSTSEPRQPRGAKVEPVQTHASSRR